MRRVARFVIICIAAGCGSNATSDGNNRKDQPPTAGKPQGKPAVSAPAGATSGAAASAGPRSSLSRLTAEHHPVFSLADNRMLAHEVRRGGLAIPLGHPGIAKYMNFRRPWLSWAINQRLDGRPVALATRNVSWLSVGLTPEQAAAITTLTLRVKGAEAQGLRVLLNKKGAESVRIGSDWQRAQIKVPAGALKAGENLITFRWAKRGRMAGKKAFAAIDWLYLGAEAPPEKLDVRLRDDAGRLWLPPQGGLTYYVHPYAGAKLRLRFLAQPADQRCDLIVSLRPEGQAPQEQTITETGLTSGETETFVDLAPIAGKVARLELRAEGASCKQGLALAEAAIVMPGPAPKVSRPKQPKNVLFWMIDNARADRYRAYNPKTRVKTPVIDQLAATGTLFTRAYIQGTESRVSHATIWTGLYPKQHRFIKPKSKLSLNWVTIAEVMRKAGRYTAAWIANGFVSKFWGFGEGWRYFRNTLHKGGGLHGEALANHTINFINTKGDQPFYVYVGTIDPHVSWRARKPWIDQYYPERYSGPYKKVVWGKDVGKIATGATKVSPTDRKRIRAVYDSTISYNDHHLGRVLKALEAKGIRDETMIVVTADHGEELWDFGRIGHGHSLRNALVAVPLLVHYPPLFGKGVRVTEGADVASLLATICDAVGAPIPDAVQAASLLPLAQGVGRGYPRPSFASQYELAHTMRLEDFKLRSGSRGIRLHDLAAPRAEREELSGKLPLTTRWLTDALSTFLIYQSRWRQARWGVPSNLRGQMADDLENGKGPGPIRPR